MYESFCEFVEQHCHEERFIVWKKCDGHVSAETVKYTTSSRTHKRAIKVTLKVINLQLQLHVRNYVTEKHTHQENYTPPKKEQDLVLSGTKCGNEIIRSLTTKCSQTNCQTSTVCPNIQSLAVSPRDTICTHEHLVQLTIMEQMFVFTLSPFQNKCYNWVFSPSVVNFEPRGLSAWNKCLFYIYIGLVAIS